MTALTGPNLIIPGAPKCGTTALADYLTARRDVFSGHVKEPNYFSSDMPSYARREGLDNPARYAAMYAPARAVHKYRLDASTHYLYSAVAAERIATELQAARWIVCIRPQAEIAHAWHMQMYNAGYDDIADFSDAWTARLDRRAGRGIPPGCPEPALLDYEGVASVGHQLERLYRHVDRRLVHVVPLDALKSDPRQVYLKVLEFLGLPDDGRTEFAPSNVAFRNRSSFASHLIRNPALRPLLNRAWTVVGPKATGFLKKNIKRVLYKPAARTPLSPTLRAEMQRTFAEDNELLRDLVGRNYSDAA